MHAQYRPTYITYMHTGMFTYMHTHRYSYIHAHSHTYIHTHTVRHLLEINLLRSAFAAIHSFSGYLTMLYQSQRLHNVELEENMNINYDWVSIWKETVVAYFLAFTRR
jgi:hypothetical protein